MSPSPKQQRRRSTGGWRDFSWVTGFPVWRCSGPLFFSDTYRCLSHCWCHFRFRFISHCRPWWFRRSRPSWFSALSSPSCRFHPWHRRWHTSRCLHNPSLRTPHSIIYFLFFWRCDSLNVCRNVYTQILLFSTFPGDDLLAIHQENRIFQNLDWFLRFVYKCYSYQNQQYGF